MRKGNKHLKFFWNRIHSAFLQAILNENVKKYIDDYRKEWNLHGHASTPDELENQIRQMFLQDAGLVNGAEIKGFGKIERDGNKVYTITKRENSRENKWLWPNPFFLKDGDEILVPESKERLIKILANIETDKSRSWIFEPRLYAVESEIVYPSSYILIITLHRARFLRSLRNFILDQLKLDYFLHWPLFFYYILTGSADFAMKNVAFQFMPYRVFVIHDDLQASWLIKSYGNADISLLFAFIKTNKTKIEKLNKLLNNPNASGRSLKEMFILLNSKDKKNQDLALEYYKTDIQPNIIKGSYADFLMRTKSTDFSYRLQRSQELILNPRTKKKFAQAINKIKTSKSRAKKSVENITHIEGFNLEVKKLVNEINNNW